jgi:sec-independent protein translocase protein TatA
MLSYLKNIGLPEIIIIAVILLLLFGGKKVKELSKGLGESKKELKNIKKDIKGETTKKDDSNE